MMTETRLDAAKRLLRELDAEVLALGELPGVHGRHLTADMRNAFKAIRMRIVVIERILAREAAEREVVG